MRLTEFTNIDESPSDSFPFKASHFVKGIAARITGKNPEKQIARKFKELQARWGEDFNPTRARHRIAQTFNLGERDVQSWLQHAGLIESEEV